LHAATFLAPSNAYTHIHACTHLDARTRARAHCPQHAELQRATHGQEGAKAEMAQLQKEWRAAEKRCREVERDHAERHQALEDAEADHEVGRRVLCASCGLWLPLAGGLQAGMQAGMGHGPGMQGLG